MLKFKKKIIQLMALVGAASFTLGACTDNGTTVRKAPLNDATISKVDGEIKMNTEDYFDANVISKLPETVAKDEEISVIVDLKSDSLMDFCQTEGKADSLTEYVVSGTAKMQAYQIEKQQNVWLNRLRSSGISYTLGERYDTLLNGFEVMIKAKDFTALNELFGQNATLIVGDVYEPAQTQPVHNYVDVYETGIFNSSKSEYQGDGVVVAVLDTGLDYTHTAFSPNNFFPTYEAFTLASVSEKIDQTVAAEFTKGLTGEDVYLNKKVPFAYDYADKDPDVLPINSEHGTHVAGIIAGKDDTITGVAPNAQLAIMKVFSDAQQGAKDSWIISSLEDCVTLGVDVINMSLGSNCGFSREVDKENKNQIYDRIREVGISLIAAAGNDYNATFSSDKNGSNGLTSNPDSGPVGAPSTYESALSVASVDGVKTPYLRYNDDIIYFNEASTSDSETKDFVDDILKTVGGVDSYDFEYAVIPGIGRSADYPEDKEFYKGKIVLVKRGTTTFEDKVRVALIEKGAAGIIIYNNVSGTISMSVGEGIGAVCSISQDEGEKLAAAGGGIIKISKGQVAGPFMSDFSSWGPTSDLKIKPEITAHGGEILSAVPGQDYDRLSGTSMAAPNQAGATALIRQYVKYSNVFGTQAEMEADPVRVTTLVNQLMMSTTDIVLNKNGLPYAVRKQGSGLVNIANAANSSAYISTFEDGKEMDKTKLELGDDKEKTGVYKMKFAINNISNGAVTYDLGAIVMTEGVSTTYTSHGDTTVTQDGYLLEGATLSVLNATDATLNGMQVTVNAKQSAMLEVQITLSSSDKDYLNDSFKYGMYVEGFITMKAVSGATVDMNVPYLAFYGDWTEAPIFDEEYYDTHKDEINAGIDEEDKLMADAYATRVIGGTYSDYIATLGSYYFIQDPKATQIAADKNKIALSNNEDGQSSSLNSISNIWAGLLRNVKEWDLKIVEDSTGRTIFTKTGHNQMKSSSSGGAVRQSSFDVDFSVLEHNLKNNTKYTVTVETYIDYGTKEEQNAKNVRNVFEFPLYIDFEAPVITNVTYRSEYDKDTRKTHLYADLSVYDNHYAMGLQLGQLVPETDPETPYIYSMKSFGKYMTPVYSTFNSTSLVSIEITDYVADMKNSVGTQYDKPGSESATNTNAFIVNCYDYAMNAATYEIKLPDEVISMYFNVEDNLIKLSPNETLELSSVLNIFPNETWLQVLDFETSDSSVVEVVNQTLLAKEIAEGEPRTATVKAIGYDSNGTEIVASVQVQVLAEGEEGYVGGYTVPQINNFAITGYKVNKAYYSISSEEREIGLTGATYEFGGEKVLSMFPSESVDLVYVLDSYFPDLTSIVYSQSDAYRGADGEMLTRYVDLVPGKDPETGKDTMSIVAKAEGTSIVSLDVKFNGGNTFYSGRVTINVKDPYTTNAIYLMSYKGLGGEVVIPGDRGITTIYAYAFSNYEYVEKDLEAGDVINDEDPYHLKQMYIGEDTITKIVIPEGVTHINEYAFAKLTALEEVVLPDSLVNIGVGAFYGCEKLKKINLEDVKFINASAFEGCALNSVQLDKINAIGNYAFKDCQLNELFLPKSSQSLGIGAFMGNSYLDSVTFDAPKVKIGSGVFEGCSQLLSISINAAVIPAYAFDGCTSLESVTLGKDVAVIGEFAFRGTNVSKFNVTAGGLLTTEQDGALIMKGTELLLVAPNHAGNVTTTATSIATGAFAGNTKIFRVYANNVVSIGNYAFSDCTQLRSVEINSATSIGNYAFAGTKLTQTPDLSKIKSIGNYAFASTAITSVTIADDTKVGDYAFCYNRDLKTVTIGSGVTLGEGVFYCPVMDYTWKPDPNSYTSTGPSTDYYKHEKYVVYDENGEPVEDGTFDYYYYDYTVGVISTLQEATIGDDTVIGPFAFAGNAKMTKVTFGENVTVGNYAFFNDASLVEVVNLSKVVSIGEQAFSGSRTQAFRMYKNTWMYAFDYEYLNGELRVVDYMYSSFAPVFTEANLASATYVGAGAFMNNKALEKITFGEGLQSVSDFAFAYCRSIDKVVMPLHITSVGQYAFYAAKISEVNLVNVDSVGEYAFARTEMKKATLKEGVSLGDAAFAYCYGLTEVQNLNKAVSIGANAFNGAALETLDLSAATFIGDFAFGESAATSVVLGENLVKLGENPFYNTEIESYGKVVDVTFNDQVVDQTVIETFNVSDKVKVIDGVLYQIVENGGLELVSYPMKKAAGNYVVETGTVRISANAFAYSAVQNVTLPAELKAIGDKAFFGCEDLTTVVFKSYQAPVLEEAYDPMYVTYENAAHTGYLGEYKGLGIAPFYMWGSTSNTTNYYYGANFVDRIGQLEKKLIMVKPTNGLYYDTFIMSQYFGTVLEGTPTAVSATLAVIDQINALPEVDRITLANEAAVLAARDAYNKLPSVEQQSLVYNYEKLLGAEDMLEYLRGSNPDVPPVVEPDTEEKKGCGSVLGLTASVSMLAVFAVAVARKTKKENE